MSNFDKVKDEFNKSFGVTNNLTPQLNIFDENPSLVSYRLDLIKEEVEELKDAIEKKDFKETIDALSDILYVVYGAFTCFGINADESFDLVHKSNMSKLCKNKKEAIATVEYYKTDTRYDSPSYRLSPDGKYYVVYNESTSKILKSINYNPVSFDSLINK
jgi:predicted HAD superfamily Cof-like phosphohydrolase